MVRSDLPRGAAFRAGTPQTQQQPPTNSLAGDVAAAVAKYCARRERRCADFARALRDAPSGRDVAQLALDLARIDGAIEALEALL